MRKPRARREPFRGSGVKLPYKKKRPSQRISHAVRGISQNLKLAIGLQLVLIQVIGKLNTPKNTPNTVVSENDTPTAASYRQIKKSPQCRKHYGDRRKEFNLDSVL